MRDMIERGEGHGEAPYDGNQPCYPVGYRCYPLKVALGNRPCPALAGPAGVLLPSYPVTNERERLDRLGYTSRPARQAGNTA
ncbi:hypothetical protein D3C84_803090 [compost metagenome]